MVKINKWLTSGPCLPYDGVGSLHVLSSLEKSTDVDVCQDRCKHSPQCAAVFVPSRGANCSYFASAGIEPCDEGSETYILKTSTDAVLEDIYSLNATAVEETTFLGCQAMCWLREGCDRFVFDPDTRECLLENNSGQGVLMEFNDTIASVEETHAFNATFAKTVSLFPRAKVYPFGKKVSVTSAKTMEECRSVCAHYDDCRLFLVSSTAECTMYEFANVEIMNTGADAKHVLMTTQYDVQDLALPTQREYRPVSNVCFRAEDLIASQVETTLHGCMTLCEVTRGCEAFDFNNQETCTLSRMPPEACTTNQTGVHLADSLFEFVPVPGFCAQGAPVDTKTTTLEGCKELCHQDSRKCQSISYDFSSGQCVTHLGIQVKPCTSTSTSTFISIAKYVDEDFSFLTMNNTMCPTSGDLLVKSNMTLAQCQRLCELEDACLSLAFDSVKQVCSLKDGSGFLQEDCSSFQQQDVLFQIKYLPDKYSEVEGNCTLVADDAKLLQRTSAEACAGICDARSDCKAFSYNATEQNCWLLDSDTNQGQEDCPYGILFVRHSSMYYTLDEGSCGGKPLQGINSMSLTLDMCKAVCDALYEACFGFTHDAATMTCVLQQDESHTTCDPGTTTTTLYLSYRESGPNAQHAFDFISGKVCHAGDNLAEDDTSSSQIQASLERCKRLCAEDSTCKAVSVKNGRCIMSSSFAFRSGCGNVHLKLRRNRFGTILTVKKGVISPPATVISDRNPAECRAICQARRDCVNVLTDCSTTTPNSCELTGVRDTSNDTDAENAVADCTPDRADVHVYESRHIFTSIRSRICRSLLSITGEFAVDSRNECAEACIALASDCTGFAFGKALVTSSFNNCVTYKSSAKLSDLHSPRCEVSGNFFPFLRDAGTLSASELKARLWMRSPNGRVARDMMRSALELQRVVDEKGQVFEAASITSGALLLPLDTVTALVAPAQEQAIASGVALQGLGKSLAGMSGALSAIPVIGKVVQTFVKKTARRTLEPAGEKLRNNGIRIGKLEKNLEKTGSKVSMIDGLFLASAGVLVSLSAVFKQVGDILVRAHMCAFEARLPPVVQRLESVMETMRNGSQVLIRHLNNIPSNVTNPFGDLKLRLDILSVKLPNLLSEFTKINLALQPFMWLTKFMDFRMCFRFFIFFEECFTVGEMLNFLGKLLGVLSFLVNPIADLFAGLFPDISLPLPSLLDSWLLDLDKIMLDIDIAYNTLFPAIQFPFAHLDLLRDLVLAKLPPLDFSCDFGLDAVEDDDDLLNDDGGLGERELAGSRNKEPPFQGTILSDASFQRTIDKLFEFDVREKENKSKRPLKSLHKSRQGGKQHDQVVGPPKADWARSSGLSVEPMTGRSAAAFSLRAHPVPLLAKNEDAYFMVSYDVTFENGTKKEEPVACFWGMDRKSGSAIDLLNSKPTRSERIETSRERPFSRKQYNIHIRPGGDPFKYNKDGKRLWSVNAKVKLVRDLPKKLSSDCSECPGAKCLRKRVRGRDLQGFVPNPSLDWEGWRMHTSSVTWASDIYSRYNPHHPDTPFFDERSLAVCRMRATNPALQDTSSMFPPASENFSPRNFGENDRTVMRESIADIVNLCRFTESRGRQAYYRSMLKDEIESYTRDDQGRVPFECREVYRSLARSELIDFDSDPRILPQDCIVDRVDEKCFLYGCKNCDTGPNRCFGSPPTHQTIRENWYEAEHVFDFSRRPQGSNGGVGHTVFNADSLGNLVMAWAAWNQKVSPRSMPWPNILREKCVVYGRYRVALVAELLDWCDANVYPGPVGNFKKLLLLDREGRLVEVDFPDLATSLSLFITQDEENSDEENSGLNPWFFVLRNREQVRDMLSEFVSISTTLCGLRLGHVFAAQTPPSLQSEYDRCARVYQNI